MDGEGREEGVWNGEERRIGGNNKEGGRGRCSLLSIVFTKKWQD